MRSKQTLMITPLLLLLIGLSARSETIDEYDAEEPFSYTLQVAAFPSEALANEFILKLERAGERPVWGTVELPGRGRWIRIFLGPFKTSKEARRHGKRLVAAMVIEEFVIRQANEVKALGRPRLARSKTESYRPSLTASAAKQQTGKALKLVRKGAGKAFVKPLFLDKLSAPASRSNRSRFAQSNPARSNSAARPLIIAAATTESKWPVGDSGEVITNDPPVWPEAGLAEVALPRADDLDPSLVPSIDIALIPAPDPVLIAFKMIASDAPGARSSQRQGGLYLSGDLLEGLSRLGWIAGDARAELVSLDRDRRMHIDASLLAAASGVTDTASPSAPLVIASYIRSNEGLLLLVQLSQSAHRYRLHIGETAETGGGEVQLGGSINLDNNFDSRINPYRRAGKKLDRECPPKEFDALVAINPQAQWLNLHTGKLVPVAHITFHELAEAYAKVDLGLNYLAQGARPGAHNLAIEREKRLKSQRPSSNVVVTTGSNRVIRSAEELEKFYVESDLSKKNQR